MGGEKSMFSAMILRLFFASIPVLIASSVLEENKLARDFYIFIWESYI